MNTYTILEYIEVNGEIGTSPVGFFAEKKDRDDAFVKNFFFTNDDKLPSKESLKTNRWAKKGEM